MRSTLAPAAVAAWLLASGCAADCKVNLKSNNPPTVAAGYSARLIASSLNTPRSIIFDKEGNLLVLEARNGIRRLTFSDDDGGTCLVEDLSKRGYVVASADLNHGIEISDDGKTLYASSPENVFSYAYNASETALDANRLLGTTLVRNMTNDDHVSRTLLLSKKQPGILLVSRGSASNIDPNAAQKSSGVSQIRAFNLSQLAKNQIYDYPSEGTLLGWGLRNSVGVAEHPVTGGIYSVENSADQIQRLGTDIHEDNPGEEMNFHGILNDSSSSSTTLLGANYGYPNCLALWSTSIPSPGSLSVGSQFTYSTSPESTTDDACNRDFIAPRLTFEAHTAPLDVKFNTTAGGDAAYVTFHGSWNRDQPAGYKLSVVAFDSAKGEPVAKADSQQAAVDVLTNPDTSKCPSACFRPVGLAFDTKGRLFMTSDSTGEIWVVQKGAAGSAGGLGENSAPPARGMGGAVLVLTAGLAVLGGFVLFIG